MKLTDFYAYTEQTFDSFCKQVIRNERTDALRELAYHAKNEPVRGAPRSSTGTGARDAIVTWRHCGSAAATTCGGVRYLRWLCFTA